MKEIIYKIQLVLKISSVNIYIVMSRYFETPREGLNYDVYGGSVPNAMLYMIKQIEGLSKPHSQLYHHQVRARLQWK
jgi:hypothetical protein